MAAAFFCFSSSSICLCLFAPSSRRSLRCCKRSRFAYCLVQSVDGGLRLFFLLRPGLVGRGVGRLGGARGTARGAGSPGPCGRGGQGGAWLCAGCHWRGFWLLVLISDCEVVASMLTGRLEGRPNRSLNLPWGAC